MRWKDTSMHLLVHNISNSDSLEPSYPCTLLCTRFLTSAFWQSNLCNMWVYVHVCVFAWKPTKGTVKRLSTSGVPFSGASRLSDHIFHAPWSRTLSITYPLCGLALANITDNPSEMCPPKLTDFCLFLLHWSYKTLRGAYSSNSFHKLSWLGLKTATPRWESQHSNHAATPTCNS